MLKLVQGPITAMFTGPAKELYDVSDELKFRPPDYWRATSYQLYKDSHGKSGWDGYLRPLKVSGIPPCGMCKRGITYKVLEAAERLGIQVDTSRELKSPLGHIVIDDVPDDILEGGLVLDDDQRGCVASWLSHGIGIHQATVSAGKTAMFAAASEMILRYIPGSRVLVLTPTERLVRQVFKEFSARFLPKRNVTQYGGGIKDNSGDIVVATNACVYRNVRELKDSGWLKQFTAVLVDECHHAHSPSMEKILDATPALFRLGASDSVKQDDDVARTKIEGHLGPVLREIEPTGLIIKGRLAVPHIYLVDPPDWHNRFSEKPHTAVPETPAWALLNGEWKKGTYLGPVYEPAVPGKDGEYRKGEEDGFKRDKKGELIKIPSLHTLMLDGHEYELSSRWCLLDRAYDQGIILFKERNRLIVEWAGHFANKGWPTLVVATRTLHVLLIEAGLKTALGEDRVRILFSEHSSKERDDVFKWLIDEPGRVLVSPLVKEGVSLPPLRGGVIADPVSSWEYARQLVGRFLRKKGDGVENSAHIAWFIDRQTLSLRKGCYNVFEELEKIRGFNFYHPVVHPSDISDSRLFKAVGRTGEHVEKA